MANTDKPIPNTDAPPRNTQTNHLATKRLLQALGAALPHQDTPATLDSSGDRQRLTDIHNQQVDAAWRQLRSRYPSAVIAARELAAATMRATTWADSLVSDGSQGYGPARLALVASLTRRLIIDGLAVARGAVEHCRSSLLELETRDDLRPLVTTDCPA